ncbi:MAG: endolytic transglycosylase MltG [Armatimonadota bacterium]
MNKRLRLLIFAVVAVILALWFAQLALLPVGGKGFVMVNVKKGASAGEVGSLLAERKLVRSGGAFRVLARLTGRSAELKPGAYRLSPSMTPLAILNKIASGEVSANWITFPEGWTADQMADRLEKEHLAEGFRAKARGMEGYLFPDTYLVPLDMTADDAIKMMRDCFQSKIRPLEKDISASGMSLHQVVTLASLIEREAKVPQDRALISAVLRNRLASGMRLECDATVIYALGGKKKRLFYKDLAVESPYNTYKHFGLPPGPIANPGLPSIEAALHPARADYLFYVARPDGSHIFSRTFEEHKRAIERARSER